VSGITGFPVQPNKAIVGKNAFAHESGIHQDGIIKSRETYEIMRAEDIGLVSNSLVLGKHSGRNAFKQKLIDLNIMPKTSSEFDDLFYKFKDLADKKHEIFDEDLINLSSNLSVTANLINFNYMNVVTESGKKPSALIKLEVDGELLEAESKGDGAVDAAFNAIEEIIQSNCKLILYSVNNITSGTDSQGEVTVRITKDKSTYNGHGADTDIVKASVLALINALNKLKQNPNQDSSKKRGV
jgi:2-isopropylmalate synthase